MADRIFDCEDITAFTRTIESVIPTRSYSNSKFYICNVNGNKFLTKLMFYRTPAPELYGKRDKTHLKQADAEIKILDILNKRIVDQGVSPCVLEMIHYQKCSTVRLTPRNCELMQADKRSTTPETDVVNTFCRYKELVQAGLAAPKCVFVVLDICDMSFDAYLRTSLNTPISILIFKSLLFQVLYTMHAIEKYLPGFKHNDLHTDNIMIKFDHNPHVSQFAHLLFTDGNDSWRVPYFNMIPKIIDFGFSVAPTEGIYSDIIDDRVMMFRRESTPDVIELFHWIYNVTYMYNRDRLQTINDILSTLEPSECYITENYFQDVKRVKTATPGDMIRSSVFIEYNTSAESSDPYGNCVHTYSM